MAEHVWYETSAYAGRKTNGEAYEGRWNGVRPSGVSGGVTCAFAGESSAPSSLSDSLGGFGSCKNLISAGSTDTISPGAKRVLASECYSEKMSTRSTSL